MEENPPLDLAVHDMAIAQQKRNAEKAAEKADLFLIERPLCHCGIPLPRVGQRRYLAVRRRIFALMLPSGERGGGNRASRRATARQLRYA